MLMPAIRCMSLLIVSLDVTIVNIALPSIQRDLHAPVSRLKWATDAYRLVLASVLMLSRSTRDRADPVPLGLAAVHPGAGPWLAGCQGRLRKIPPAWAPSGDVHGSAGSYRLCRTSPKEPGHPRQVHQEPRSEVRNVSTPAPLPPG